MASKVEEAAEKYADAGFDRQGETIYWQDRRLGFKEGIDWLIDRCEEWCNEKYLAPTDKRHPDLTNADCFSAHKLLDFIKELIKEK